MFNTLLFMIWVHFVGDFLLQRREVAVGKSSNIVHMAEHGTIILIITFVGSLIAFRGASVAYLFSLILTALHVSQDFLIWNAYRGYRKDSVRDFWRDPLFYTVIGLDQMLHVTALIMVMKYFEGSIPYGWG